MVAWGMTPWDALRSATVVAADLLGPHKDGKLGCLDAGLRRGPRRGGGRPADSTSRRRRRRSR